MSSATAQAQGPRTELSERRRRRWLRLPYLIWLAVAALAVAGGLLIRYAHHDQLRSFEVPTRTLPAFHIIGAQDVHPLRLPRNRVPGDALVTASSVIGRVTLTEINANLPLTRSELGPVLKGVSGNLAVIGVPATAAMALDGHLNAGDQLGVFVSTGKSKKPDAIARLLAVRQTKSGDRPYVLIVSVPLRTPRAVIEGLSTGTAWIVREPGP